MRLYAGKIPIISAEIVGVLTDGGEIEVADATEAQLDVQAVLREYLRRERDINEEAKDYLSRRGLTYSQFGKVKKMIAQQQDFGVGEETITYIIQQIIMAFENSNNFEEIYADDQALTVKIRNILRKHMDLEEDLDNEVRDRIKNLEEGTRTWEVEYAKVMEQIRRKKGLE
ncbi:MAG: DUF507 family protein [Deltaproteobacteria bacterium]|nr:DUF507 family protein [Deltaproteobacteria bacterium]